MNDGQNTAQDTGIDTAEFTQSVEGTELDFSDVVEGTELDGTVNAELDAVQEEVLLAEGQAAPETPVIGEANPNELVQKRPETLEELTDLVMGQQLLLENLIRALNDTRQRHHSLAQYVGRMASDEMTLDAFGIGIMRRQDHIQRLLTDEKMWEDVVQSLDIEVLTVPTGTEAEINDQYCRALLVEHGEQMNLTLFRPTAQGSAELSALNFDENMFNRRLYQKIHELAVQWHGEGKFTIDTVTKQATLHIRLNGWTTDAFAKYYTKEEVTPISEAFDESAQAVD